MKIGLIGFGKLAQEVEKMLFKQKENIKKRFGEEITIQAILVRDVNRSTTALNKTAFFTENFYDLLEDPDISALVDLTNSCEDAFFYLSEGLKAGKHVITANESLVSKYLEELFQLAADNNKAFLYGASLGGATSIIKSIIDSSKLNEITYVRGLLDGPCNLILSQLEDGDKDLEEVLEDNKEVSTKFDLSGGLNGLSSRKKASILISLALAGRVKEEDISCFGVSNIDNDDLQIMRELDSSIKMIAEGAFKDGKYFATVMPTFISKKDLFSQIKTSKNIISYEGDKLDQVSLITADGSIVSSSSAIIRDLVDVMEGTKLACNPLTKGKITLSNQDMEGYFYIRLNKKYERVFDGLYEEKTDLFDQAFILTKKIRFGIILDLVKDLDRKDFFLARIIKDEK